MSGHNRLAALAADFRALHAGIRRNAEQMACEHDRSRQAPDRGQTIPARMANGKPGCAIT